MLATLGLKLVGSFLLISTNGPMASFTITATADCLNRLRRYGIPSFDSLRSSTSLILFIPVHRTQLSNKRHDYPSPKSSIHEQWGQPCHIIKSEANLQQLIAFRNKGTHQRCVSERYSCPKIGDKSRE
jgi:hypothetical protein